VIGLIGCSSQKLDRSAPARELYCSALFRKALAYADPLCERTYALSGALGLVELDTVIEPYDLRLGVLERGPWGRRVAAELVARHGHEVEYLILAGREYAEPVATWLARPDKDRGERCRSVPRDRILTPLDGMQIGQRLRWLNEQARGAEAA
jgi:hypothetical protein